MTHENPPRQIPIGIAQRRYGAYDLLIRDGGPGLAHVTIDRLNTTVHEFDVDSYRRWNIFAHFPDIVEVLERERIDAIRR